MACTASQLDSSLNTPERRFKALLQTLLKDYQTIRDGIDSQPIVVEEGLA